MTIRLKVTMAAIAVILVANSLLSLVGLEYAQRVWLREVQSRVRLNLNSARSDYNHHVNGIARFLRACTLDQGIASAVGRDDVAGGAAFLENVHRVGGMDFVTLVDATGKVICRAGSPDGRGDDLSDNPLIERVIEVGAPVAGTIILSAESLAREGRDLAARARFEVLPTRAARPPEKKSRSDGMVVAAAVPFRDSRGQLLGILYGGDLLNRRFEIVDSIKQEVFPHEPHKGKEVGAVAIFQGDLRVSTSLTREDGSREVGTQLSDTVYDQVLLRGGTWADRALVVDDWYFTAYEPIRDPEGQIVGVLGIGLLEAPFVHKRNVLMAFLLAMVIVATLASLVLVFFATNQVLRPVGRITAMSRKVIAGDLTARVGLRPSGEMGVLCRAIDSMADAIAEREEQLRTATRQQIGQSEKLASIGRLAAGVAHEINNPLTGVLTFAHLLKEDETIGEEGKRDLDLIIQETTRVAEIVRGLLDFARERPTAKEQLDVNEIIRRTLRLLGNQGAFRRIVIVEDLDEGLPPVDGDVNQLQQILLNLSLNACEAMRNGGTLLVGSSAENGCVLVKVTDTGCGIKREHLDQIFEPFFSTKPVGKGTGLGLSVSYGIVQQHGGALEVETEEGKGTTFTVVLPSAKDRQSGSRDGKVNR
ncbi:MAG TPA: cache domain-containing protein [Thermoguttaceae bacterium]|nr:cache domain-containing protein [Thermoguttaceae bacterium]